MWGRASAFGETQRPVGQRMRLDSIGLDWICGDASFAATGRARVLEVAAACSVLTRYRYLQFGKDAIKGRTCPAGDSQGDPVRPSQHRRSLRRHGRAGTLSIVVLVDEAGGPGDAGVRRPTGLLRTPPSAAAQQRLLCLVVAHRGSRLAALQHQAQQCPASFAAGRP